MVASVKTSNSEGVAKAERLAPKEPRWPYFRGLALVLQKPQEGIQLLERAASRFGELNARWERACTELSLAEALLASGDRASAAALLDPALAVFEELRSLREAARARELLET